MLANYESYAYFKKAGEKVVDIKNAEKSMETRDRIVRECVEHENQPDYENYLAGVICSYWFLIDYYYRKDVNQSIEDYQSWVIEGILKGLKYRGWTDPKQQVSKDPLGAAKVINRCIHTVIGNHLITSRRDCRIANNFCDSIDNFISEDGDTFADLNLLHEEPTMINVSTQIIQKYADAGRIMDAIIIDSICNGGELKAGKFSMRKLSSDLANLNDQYVNYFIDTYPGIEKKEVKLTCEQLVKMSHESRRTNAKLKKAIRNVLDEIKNDKGTMKLLCC